MAYRRLMAYDTRQIGMVVSPCQGWELSYVREARSLFELTKRHPEVASALLLQNR